MVAIILLYCFHYQELLGLTAVTALGNYTTKVFIHNLLYRQPLKFPYSDLLVLNEELYSKLCM